MWSFIVYLRILFCTILYVVGKSFLTNCFVLYTLGKYHFRRTSRRQACELLIIYVPALPCPALPCPALPCPALLWEYDSSIYVAVSTEWTYSPLCTCLFPTQTFFDSCFRSQVITHLVYPQSSVLDDSIGCALWFAARGAGTLICQQCVENITDVHSSCSHLPPYTSPVKVWPPKPLFSET